MISGISRLQLLYQNMLWLFNGKLKKVTNFKKSQRPKGGRSFCLDQCLVIKKYIYHLGAKPNDPLHIDYVPNVFKFTKISAKRTQESLKRYERVQKRQMRPNVTTTKIFTASCIFNNSRMASLHSIICRNYFPYSVL